MKQISATSAGRRAMEYCLDGSEKDLPSDGTVVCANKWEIFKHVCNAKDTFNVSARDLTVLNALISFFPGADLKADGNLVVFPSNKTLSDRTHGMAESTLRRHLTALIKAGLIARRSSPNGKRYARRTSDGQIRHVFGFDLRPLLTNATHIYCASQNATEQLDRIKTLRDDIASVRAGIIDWFKNVPATVDVRTPAQLAETLETTRRVLRRKLNEAELRSIKSVLETALNALPDVAPATTIPDVSDSQNERHYQSSKKEYLNKKEGMVSRAEIISKPAENHHTQAKDLTLTTVKIACSQIKDFSTEPILDWRNLQSTANNVRRMMGIRDHTWAEASEKMGARNAAITIAGILQRFSEIKSPSAYLHALTRKASAGKYTPEPMIQSLMRQARC